MQSRCSDVLFFNDTATTEIYTLSLHDALPICARRSQGSRALYPPAVRGQDGQGRPQDRHDGRPTPGHHNPRQRASPRRSEEHTSELQSRQYLVCRLLLEKKKTTTCKTSRPQRL